MSVPVVVDAPALHTGRGIELRLGALYRSVRYQVTLLHCQRVQLHRRGQGACKTAGWAELLQPRPADVGRGSNKTYRVFGGVLLQACMTCHIQAAGGRFGCGEVEGVQRLTLTHVHPPPHLALH